MEGILSTFGVDWRLLVTQAINFGLLLFGLTYFLYKPLMHTLESRRAKIAEGIKDAETVAKEKEKLAESRAGILANAGKEADEILSHARSAGTQKEREILKNAEAAATRVLTEAEREAQELKDQAIQKSKQEVAKLVVLGIEKMAK